MLDSVAWVPPENSWGDKEEIHPFPFSLVSHVKDSIFAPPFAFFFFSDFTLFFYFTILYLFYATICICIKLNMSLH